ncbi:hypothetical protein MY11210_008004 [Beauveria gryllotalpidicola]
MLQPDQRSPLQTDPSPTIKEPMSENSPLKDGTESSPCKNSNVGTAVTKESGDSESPTPSSRQPPYCALSEGRKRFAVTIVTLAGAVGPLSGTMYLPVLPLLAREFGVSDTSINASVSIFMVTFAFAPLIWSSFADYRGRRPIYIVSLAIFVISNLLLAVLPRSFAIFMVMRVLHAFGAGAVVSMGAASIADITEPAKRGSKMSIFMLGPQCGPVFGPVIGSALGGAASWRWIPGFLALFSFVLWLMIVLCLPETLRYRAGNGRIAQEKSWFIWPPRLVSAAVSEHERGPKPPKPTLKGYWKLFSYPPIGIVSVNTAILYATYFAMTVALPWALEDRYGWTTTTVGLGYLAVGIALVVGNLLGGQFNDWRRARRVAASLGAEVEPERRLEDQIWGVLICVAGTAMFGWFIDRSIHVAAVIIATSLAGFGMSWVFIASSAFLGECVPLQAAGAFALGNMLRNPAAAIASVVYPTLKQKMGIAWFFTGFAIFDFVAVGSAVMILRRYGPHWRKKKSQASGRLAQNGGK